MSVIQEHYVSACGQADVTFSKGRADLLSVRHGRGGARHGTVARDLEKNGCS